jgi:hypothetical protein
MLVNDGLAVETSNAPSEKAEIIHKPLSPFRGLGFVSPFW